MLLKGRHSNWWNDSAIDSSMMADAAQDDVSRAIYCMVNKLVTFQPYHQQHTIYTTSKVTF